VAYATHSTLKPVPSIICTRLFRGKMHSDCFSGIEIHQGRWQHGEKVRYCYPSGLEKTLCKWDRYVPLVTEGLTSALDWGRWSTPRPGRFSPGKVIRYPFYRRLGGSQGRCVRLRKISPQLEFDSRTVQPV
jgi:hypothetical protein